MVMVYPLSLTLTIIVLIFVFMSLPSARSFCKAARSVESLKEVSFWMSKHPHDDVEDSTQFVSQSVFISCEGPFSAFLFYSSTFVMVKADVYEITQMNANNGRDFIIFIIKNLNLL